MQTVIKPELLFAGMVVLWLQGCAEFAHVIGIPWTAEEKEKSGVALKEEETQIRSSNGAGDQLSKPVSTASSPSGLQNEHSQSKETEPEQSKVLLEIKATDRMFVAYFSIIVKNAKMENGKLIVVYDATFLNADLSDFYCTGWAALDVLFSQKMQDFANKYSSIASVEVDLQDDVSNELLSQAAAKADTLRDFDQLELAERRSASDDYDPAMYDWLKTLTTEYWESPQYQYKEYGNKRAELEAEQEAEEQQRKLDEERAERHKQEETDNNLSDKIKKRMEELKQLLLAREGRHYSNSQITDLLVQKCERYADSDACLFLGFIYATRNQCDRPKCPSEGKSLEYCEKACLMGNVEACQILVTAGNIRPESDASNKKKKKTSRIER